MKIQLAVLLLLGCLQSKAQVAASEAQAAVFYGDAMPVIKPAYRALIMEKAAALNKTSGSADALKKELRANPQLARLADTDLEGLVVLVLYQAARDARADLKQVASEAKQSNQSKVGPRDLLAKRTAIREISGTRPAAAKGEGTLGEMSETEQLRLQMVMERRQKHVEALSNLMKKIASTQSQIIGNLK